MLLLPAFLSFDPGLPVSIIFLQLTCVCCPCVALRLSHASHLRFRREYFYFCLPSCLPACLSARPRAFMPVLFLPAARLHLCVPTCPPNLPVCVALRVSHASHLRFRREYFYFCLPSCLPACQPARVPLCWYSSCLPARLHLRPPACLPACLYAWSYFSIFCYKLHLAALGMNL